MDAGSKAELLRKGASVKEGLYGRAEAGHCAAGCHAFEQGGAVKTIVILAAAMAAAAVPASAQMSDEQKAAIAGDPSHERQELKLVDVPAPAGPAVPLFNGRDLDDWQAWLGYQDPSLTYLEGPAKPIGIAGKGSMFKVVEEDGEPALYVNGETWGSLVHGREFENYHLRLEYKWGDKRYPPRLDLPHNNGLLYHSTGRPGTVFGTWMPAVEFEIMKGSVGMVVPVGPHIGVTTNAAHDPTIIYPMRRFMTDGREVAVKQPAWNVEAASDAERPVGEWNVLDLYVLGDRAIHVVNGVPVMALRDLRISDPATGTSRPLTRGRVQFQSEGAETYFRNITVEPITSMPRIVAE